MVLDFCRRVDSPDQMVYVQATRGVGPRGHAYVNAGPTPSIWAFVRPNAMRDPFGAYRCITVEDTRFLHCNIKTINLLPPSWPPGWEA